MTRYEKDLVRIVFRRLGVPYTLDDEKADQQELLKKNAPAVYHSARVF